jgi:hypothetical protein
MQLFAPAEIEQPVRVGRGESRMSPCISGNDGRVLILNVSGYHAIEIHRSNSLIIARESLGILGKSVLTDVWIPK